jgi:hypothetical protein
MRISRSVPPQWLINLANPAILALLRSPVHAALDRSLLVVEIVGSKTGRHYDIPVGYADLDGELIVITQHSWRANVRGGADIDVTLRGQRHCMHCTLEEDPHRVAAELHRLMGKLGPKASRRLTGLKTPSGREPSVNELEAAVREFGLATLTLTPSAQPVGQS